MYSARFFRIAVVFLLLIFHWSCGDDEVNSESKSETIEIQDRGNVSYFVTPSYFDRNEGLPWMAIKIKPAGPGIIKLSLRSSVNTKETNPNCSFDGQAYEIADSSYKFYIMQTEVHIDIMEDGLDIYTIDTSAKSVLECPCENGNSIRGVYKKLDEPLDMNGIDKTVFHKKIKRDDFQFILQSETAKELAITFIHGEARQNLPTIKIKDDLSILDAESEDLDNDGFPELLIYLQSNNAEAYGEIKAISMHAEGFENIRSLNTKENTAINKNYRGHDEFKIVNNTLVQRFPIYLAEDQLKSASGGFRKIAYQLQGETGAKFFQIKAIQNID